MGNYTHIEVGVTSSGCKPRCELCDDYRDEAVEVLVVTPNQAMTITISVAADGSGTIDISGKYTLKFGADIVALPAHD
jgi:hypothetical protein